MAGARPTARRSNIPWLPIGFAVATVAMGVVTALVVMQKNQLVADRDTAQGDLMKVVKNKGEIINAAEYASHADRVGESLLTYLVNETQRLAAMIDTDAKASSEQLRERAEALAKDISGADQAMLAQLQGRSLLERMKNLGKMVADLRTEVADRKAQNEKLEKELADARKELKDVTDKFTDSANKAAAQLAQEMERHKAYVAERDKEFAVLEKKLEEMSERKEAAERQAQTDREKTTIELNNRSMRIKQLQDTLAGSRTAPQPLELASVADGQVYRVLPTEGIVYINLGRPDRISLGMRFVVFSPEIGLSKEGEGKAIIEVISVDDRFSECKIVIAESGQAVRVGDMIANPVYDKNRKYHFAVFGDFDLNYDGQTDRDGLERVANLVEAWGGVVGDKVAEDTDFLVLGNEPEKPRTSETELTEEERLEHKRKMERWEAYHAAKGDAKALGVEVLTRNRFLNMMGQGPKATAPGGGVKRPMQTGERGHLGVPGL